MKKTYIFFIIAIIFIVISGSLLSFQKNQIIIQITSVDMYPLGYVEDQQIKGFDIEIAETIFDNLGIKYNHSIYEWSEVMQRGRSGDADLLLGASYSTEREKFFYYTTEQITYDGSKENLPISSLWETDYHYYYKEGQDLDLSSRETIRDNNYRVAVIKEFQYINSLYDSELNMFLYNSPEEIAQAISDNEVDIGILPNVVMPSILDTLGLTNIIHDPNILLTEPSYAVFTKNSKHPQLKKIREAFDEELVRLKQSGEYNRIYNKYF